MKKIPVTIFLMITTLKLFSEKILRRFIGRYLLSFLLIFISLISLDNFWASYVVYL